MCISLYFYSYLENETDLPQTYKPTQKVCIAVQLIGRLMKSKGYALYRGEVYKRAPEAKYTYVYCSTVKQFVMASLSNPQIADAVAQHIEQINKLLSDPACKMIKPLVIDYNYIEVLPKGTCFDIAGKKFVKDPKMLGSPRAFVKYRYHENIVPYPAQFIRGN